MSTTTPNIGLTKPLNTENYSLIVWNGNSDIIDGEITDAKAGSNLRIFKCKNDTSSNDNALNVQAGDGRYVRINQSIVAFISLAYSHATNAVAIFNQTGAGKITSFLTNGLEKAYIDNNGILWSNGKRSVSAPVNIGSSWDGDNYDDSLYWVGTNPSAKIYPDGSVVGTTDNGTYTRYPNGNLECKRTIATDHPNSTLTGGVYVSGKVFSLTPCLFISTPQGAIAHFQDNTGSGFWVKGRASTNDWTTVAYRNETFSTGANIGNIQLTAIGRWKL